MKDKLGSKLLKIEELYFFLPDDFDGTYGDALALLAQYQKEREVEKATSDGTGNAWSDLMNDEKARHASKFVIAEKGHLGWFDIKVGCGVATDDVNNTDQENE